MDRNRLRHARPLLAAALAAIGFAATGIETFTVTLWANDDGVDGLPDIVSMSDHPCGVAAEVRLARMPPYRSDAGRFGTELIVEARDDGGEIARWSVPLDYEPLAVRGSEVLLRLGDQQLWIATDGSLRREPGRRDQPAAVPSQCPSGGPFEESAYAICARFTDVATEQQRLLRYESPCT